MRSLDLEEAALFCKCCKDTLRQLAANGEVPGKKVGRAWVFVDEQLAEYIGEKKQSRGKRWRSQKEVVTGGLTSALEVDQELESLLG